MSTATPATLSIRVAGSCGVVMLHPPHKDRRQANAGGPQPKNEDAARHPHAGQPDQSHPQALRAAGGSTRNASTERPLWSTKTTSTTTDSVARARARPRRQPRLASDD